jgi:fructose-1,6-bisphosphatase I
MHGSHWRDFETLESFIAKEERIHATSRGVFSSLLRRIGLASKVIGAKVQRAGLLNLLGEHGRENVHGERQAKLDVLANEVLKATFSWMPRVAGIVSEEDDTYVAFPPQHEHVGDRYIILFDPLDGSSNIEANVSVGTIFSIVRVGNGDRSSGLEDYLQPGARQEAAGYIIYGSSTMFVFTAGHGVHGFTLDPEVGEYILSHEHIRVPDACRCFSANCSNYATWDAPTKQFYDLIIGGQEDRYRRTTTRYIGSLVADFHRNLLYGGVFMYPADSRYEHGKLRLLYECAPMALLIEQAGGTATTGRERVLDIQPTDLHMRVPIVLGNRTDIERYEALVRRHDDD